MRRKLARFFAILVLTLPVLLNAQNPTPAPAAGAQAPGGAPRGARGPAGPANQPQARDDARHKGFLEIAQKGNIDLLFVGDSITDWFSNPFRGGAAPGLEVWNANFAALKPANFGIAGDTTQGVLWRMQNGELEGFKAKLIVLMLGTNNINRNPVDEIVDGDRLIIEEFKKRQPQAKVLLLGVFPRNADPANPLRATIKEINGKLARLADNKQVFFMDIGDKFLTADGTLTTEVMADGLHPTARGYQIWADAISGRVKELMK
ncbi:MAG TPA: GDSL-type esterase/lipase family protein [Terriglobia bacterium]|nr:GDSL-type esterase/lipase family protein [Terriglobia bacterium]